MTWSDIYAAADDAAAIQILEPPTDDGYLTLIQLVPEDRREMAGPMLEMLLANMHQLLGDENYVVFCDDVKQGWQFFTEGNRDSANEKIAKYGFSFDMLESMM